MPSSVRDVRWAVVRGRWTELSTIYRRAVPLDLTVKRALASWVIFDNIAESRCLSVHLRSEPELADGHTMIIGKGLAYPLKSRRKKKRSRAVQRELPFRRWGGRRAGAGRKPAGLRPGVPHTARPLHQERHPVHVTLRAARHLPSLRDCAPLT